MTDTVPSTKGSLHRSGSLPSLVTPPVAVAGDAPLAFVSPNLSQQAHTLLLKNWNKPMMKLPVYKDLPRLSRGLKIVDKDGLVLFEDDAEMDRAVAVPKLMVVIAQLLGENHVADALEAQFVGLFKGGDIQQDMLKIFQSNCIPPESRTCRVLKTVQQEVVSAAYDQLRKIVYTQFPFKDVRKSWKIQVEIGAERVTVMHRKSEQSHAAEPSKTWSFEWCMELAFAPKMSSFSGSLHILDYYFPEYAEPHIQHQLISLLEPLLKQTHPYQKVLDKTTADLRLLPHLLRSVDKFELIDSNRKILFAPDATQNSQSNLAKFVYHTCSALDEPIEDPTVLLQPSQDQSARDAKKSEQLRDFFASAETKKHKIARLLKCLHPEIKSVGVRKLRSALLAAGYEIDEFNEKYSVSIQVLENEIVVTHSGRTPGFLRHTITRQPSSPRDIVADHHAVRSESYPSFEVTWNICLAFNSSLRRFACDTKVLDFVFNGRQSQINDFKKCIDPFVSREVQFYRLMGKEASEYQVHNSLPKIAGNTTIVAGPKALYSNRSGDDASFLLVEALAEALDPSQSPHVTHALEKYRKKTKNLPAEELASVLRDSLRDLFVNDVQFASSCVGRLLRALDRQMLALAMVKIREKFQPGAVDFIPGEKWSVSINISDSRIRVWHNRNETLRIATTDVADPDQAQCEITWRLELVFDIRVSEIQYATVSIMDWDFPHTTRQEYKQRLTDLIDPLVPDHAPYERALKTPLKSCNLGADVIYAAKYLRIYGGSRELLFDGTTFSDNVPLQRRVKEYLTILIDHFLWGSERNICLEKLAFCLESKSDPAAGVELFCRTLIDEGIQTDESALINVIKAMSQVGLTPAVAKLRKEYYSQFPYRPVKGSWNIKVRLDKEKQKVYVYHLREEQSASDDVEKYFSFEWQVRIAMQSLGSKLAIQFQINKLDFDEKTSADTRAQLLAAFKDLGGADRDLSADSNAASIEAIEAVRLVLKSLRKLPNQLKVKHSDLPGLTATALLESLEKALTQQTEKSIRVLLPNIVRSASTSGPTTPRTPVTPRHNGPNANRVSLGKKSEVVTHIPVHRLGLGPSSPRKIAPPSPK